MDFKKKKIIKISSNLFKPTFIIFSLSLNDLNYKMYIKKKKNINDMKIIIDYVQFT